MGETRVKATMRAVVLDGPGPPEALVIRDLPIPTPQPGWVLIGVKAFGLNRSELHTRLGLAEGVTFPRVPGHRGHRRRRRRAGRRVRGRAAGRHDDGRDGPHVRRRLRRVHVRARRAGDPVSLEPGVGDLGAVPEMLQTAYGSLTVGLDAQPGQTLLIRGGTSSVGMAAAVLAKDRGLTVLSTTRRPDRGRRRSRRSAWTTRSSTTARSPPRVREHRPGRRRRRARARRHADAARHAARHARPRRRLLHRDAEQRVDGARLLPDRLPAHAACALPATAARRPTSPPASCSRSWTTSPPAASMSRSTAPTPSTRSPTAHADMEARQRRRQARRADGASDLTPGQGRGAARAPRVRSASNGSRSAGISPSCPTGGR